MSLCDTCAIKGRMEEGALRCKLEASYCVQYEPKEIPKEKEHLPVSETSQEEAAQRQALSTCC